MYIMNTTSRKDEVRPAVCISRSVFKLSPRDVWRLAVDDWEKGASRGGGGLCWLRYSERSHGQDGS